MFTSIFSEMCSKRGDIPDLLTQNPEYPPERQSRQFLPDKPRFTLKQPGFLQADRKFLCHAVLQLKLGIFVKKHKVSWGSRESGKSGKSGFHRQGVLSQMLEAANQNEQIHPPLPCTPASSVSNLNHLSSLLLIKVSLPRPVPHLFNHQHLRPEPESPPLHLSFVSLSN